MEDGRQDNVRTYGILAADGKMKSSFDDFEEENQ